MKMILVLLVLLVGVVAAVMFSQDYLKEGAFPFAKKPIATINNQKFELLVAKSAKEKEVGLSEKTSLPENTGMLFVFDNPDYYAFWMKKMKFAVDILYINKNRIVTMYQNVQPPKSEEEIPPIIKPDEPANMVLEINAGLSEKYKFKKGDEVKIENLQ